MKTSILKFTNVSLSALCLTALTLASAKAQKLSDIQEGSVYATAIKVDGKRLYEKARKGQTDEDVVIKPREVEIKIFEPNSSNQNLDGHYDLSDFSSDCWQPPKMV